MKFTATYGALYPTESLEFVFKITDPCADTSKTTISVPDSVTIAYTVADPKVFI